MTYLHIQFQMLSPDGSSVIAIKPRAKQRFHTAAMFLFYIPQIITLTKAAYFSNMLSSIISGPYIKWR
jgi:hypothetical protein